MNLYDVIIGTMLEASITRLCMYVVYILYIHVSMHISTCICIFFSVYIRVYIYIYRYAHILYMGIFTTQDGRKAGWQD